ncbi:MAG: proliferating cell nuclear antigen (pcna) [Candidatus Aenigmarchaeota archaeon]|nr:proliferating cell nuclear antigen (pcna) [Candidatus Aenigmarchaeota archaeon]
MMTFRAVLENVGILRDGLGALSELVSEGIFVTKDNGLKFSATDPTMVVLIDFELRAAVFKEYKAEKETEIAINIDSLLAVLKRVGAEDTVSLDVENETNKLNITITGKSLRKFTIPLLEIEKGEIPEMNLDFPATVEISTSVFSGGIADASIVGDTIILSAKEGSFGMASEGDTSNMSLLLDKDSEGVVAVKAITEAKSKFSLDYLKKIDRATKLSDTAKIYLGKDYPLKVVFDSPDKVRLSYVLAPRVED